MLTCLNGTKLVLFVKAQIIFYRKKMKNIIVAEAQGFCWGVRRALEIVEKLGPLSILGDLIHNKQVVALLEAKGKQVIHEVTGKEQTPIAVTAHGTTVENVGRIQHLGLELVDTTCPLVSSIYEAGRELEAQGYRILILGDAQHVEVKGIASRMQEPIIINDETCLAQVNLPNRIGVISQSTFSPKKFDHLVELIRLRVPEVKVKNTICAPTKRRQIAAEKLAKQVEVMIVVGGFHSSNTKKLAQQTAQYVETHHIETADQLEESWFAAKDEIGITAGASTPDWIIEAVANKIASFAEEAVIVKEGHES